MSDFVSHFPRFNGGIYFISRASGQDQNDKKGSLKLLKTPLRMTEKVLSEFSPRLTG